MRASNDKCPKAVSNMGHAFFALGKYEDAEKWYLKLKDMGKAKTAETYLERITRGKFINYKKI